MLTLDDYASQYSLSRVVMVVLLLAALLGFVVFIWGSYTLYHYNRFLSRKKTERRTILALEKQTLLTLFDSLNGNEWKDKTKWCSDEPIDRWKGVKVNRSGRIQKIILDDNQLSGTCLSGNYFEYHLFLSLSYSNIF